MLCDVDFSLKNNVLICVLLMGLLSTSLSTACPAHENVGIKTACRACSIIEPARGNMSYQNSDHPDSFFTQLQQESLQKVEALQKDSTFQNILGALQNSNYSPPTSSFPRRRESRETLTTKDVCGDKKHKCTLDNNLEKETFIANNAWVPAFAGMTREEEVTPSLYIFISFSMGEKALLNLAQDAKQFGATLVLRGFHEGSYKETANAFHKIILETGQGVIIDPELYSLFDVTAVPTYVLAKPFTIIAAERVQTPVHDKLQGHVSIRYALEQFEKEGDLKDEAQDLLTRGATP